MDTYYYVRLVGVSVGGVRVAGVTEGDLQRVLGFILKKKNSAPTKMDEIREDSVQFRAEFGEFLEIESQNSFRI